MNDKTKFWTGLGWCLCWLGFGSCCYLANLDSHTPAVKIENSFNTWPLMRVSPGDRLSFKVGGTNVTTTVVK